MPAQGGRGLRGLAQLTVILRLAYLRSMLATIVPRLSRIALFLALTVALVGTGFAHRLSVDDGERLAFILATGATATDVCDDATPGAGHHHAPCLACQIAGGALLPPATGAEQVLALAPSAGIVRAADHAPVPRRLDHSHTAQAPPVL
ncbi:MAG: hypothetical protein MUE83_16395 [Tabrizicola sp.]|jgi:hypothetical protein|nr:hypothetical protein [Tabrizicola sp.]